MIEFKSNRSEFQPMHCSIEKKKWIKYQFDSGKNPLKNTKEKDVKYHSNTSTSMIEITSQSMILEKHLMQREAFSSGKHSLFEKVQLCALRAVSRKKDRLFTAFLFLRCAPINALVLVQNYHGAASLTNQTLRKFVSRCAFKVSTQFSACFSILASLSSLLKPITTVSSLVVICIVKRGMFRFRQILNCT
mgnify:CR=1 FL=1